ncbi:MAG: gliding motility lipoprotein GldH [Paludibacteraceae bacterium]
MGYKKLFILCTVIIVTNSCRRNEIFFQYKNITQQGWSKDSVANFDIHITDKDIPYNFFIHLRHRGNYPYQNIWLFLEQSNPNKKTKKDTVEVYLADQYGKWLGSGAGSLKEMQIFYQKQILFPDTGVYHLGIKQGMRDSLLRGVNNVGVRIEKANQQ